MSCYGNTDVIMRDNGGLELLLLLLANVTQHGKEIDRKIYCHKEAFVLLPKKFTRQVKLPLLSDGYEQIATDKCIFCVRRIYRKAMYNSCHSSRGNNAAGDQHNSFSCQCFSFLLIYGTREFCDCWAINCMTYLEI